jgi:flagellar M-ring protein FliF
MAEQSTQRGLSLRDLVAQNPWLRQLLMMVGIAASVAVGTGAVLWSKQPEYQTLYASLAPEQASSVIDALSSVGIPYRLQAQSGAIMVPAELLHDARIRLAGAGIINDGSGLEMLREEKGFGVSDFMQSKKYEHALETELARTIESMHQIRKARVHLAMPKQSVFVRDRREPSASVMLDIFVGSNIDREQVKAIINMVSASVADLKAESVTVVDQRGNLLSAIGEESAFDVSSKQFEYRKKIEREYERRISALLTPIAGNGRVRVQAAVELDFSHEEESRESWNPDSKVVRSEQVNIDRIVADQKVGGVPGALSNQPATPRADGNTGEAGPDTESSSITRNYEIERVLNYTAKPAGAIRKLSIAVVLDGQEKGDEESEVRSYSADQIAQLTALVRDAVGFEEARGDRVTVISASFLPVDVNDVAIEEPAFWEQSWFVSLAKQSLTGLAVILIVLVVIRPGMKNLMQTSLPAARGTGSTDGDLNPAMAALTSGAARMSYDDSLNSVRTTAEQNPRLVAQVVKKWVTDDAR